MNWKWFTMSKGPEIESDLKSSADVPFIAHHSRQCIVYIVERDEDLKYVELNREEFCAVCQEGRLLLMAK